LPQELRRRYAEHLLTVLPLGAQILLLTIEYDQSAASGPPFAVHSNEVTALFGARCAVELLERSAAEQMPPRFQAQGIRTAGESTYRIIKER
jgi:thiopurine S-methyltransferase